MIFSTYLVFFSVFPSLIAYNHLSFVMKNMWNNRDMDSEYGKAYMAQVQTTFNVGLYLLGAALGTILSGRCGHKLESKKFCGISLGIMAFLSIYIVWSTIRDIKHSQTNLYKRYQHYWTSDLFLVAVFCLGTGCALFATYFMSLKPDRKYVPLEFQARASTLRTYTRSLGTIFGLIIQMSIIFAMNSLLS